VMANILVSLRATQRQRPVPDVVRAQVMRMLPGDYMWHWQAWRMGGFERANEVGSTPEGNVVVIQPGVVLYGNPLTEEVVRIEPELPGPQANPKYRVH
jgi:hypothetical protein